MAGGFQVYFQSGTCDLDAAVRALTGYGMKVKPNEGFVTVSRPGSPELRRRNTDPNHPEGEKGAGSSVAH